MIIYEVLTKGWNCVEEELIKNMIEIYKVEVSSNGRTHIKHVDDNPNIELSSSKEIDSKRKELEEFYSQKFPNMGNVTIYLSYTKK